MTMSATKQKVFELLFNWHFLFKAYPNQNCMGLFLNKHILTVKYEQVLGFPRIFSHLLQKSVIESFAFFVVIVSLADSNGPVMVGVLCFLSAVTFHFKNLQ